MIKQRQKSPFHYFFFFFLILGIATQGFAQRKYLSVVTADSSYRENSRDTLTFYLYAHMEMPVSFMLYNPEQSAVTLTANVQGEDFFLDQARTQKSAQFLMAPGQIDWGSVWFKAKQSGKYYGLLTINDGSKTDSLLFQMIVEQASSNFLVYKDTSEIRVPLYTPTPISISVMNVIDSSLTLNYSLASSTEFILTTPSTSTVPALGFDFPTVEFASTSVGKFQASLFITDGVTIDTVTFTVIAEPINLDSSEIVIDGFFGNRGFIEMNVSPTGAATSTMRVINITNNPVTVHTDLLNKQGTFSLSDTLFTIDGGQSKLVKIDFSGDPSIGGDGFLRLFTTNSEVFIYLLANPSDSLIVGGLQLSAHMDFGIVDSTATECRNFVIRNTIGVDIPISKITLSGFATEFSITDKSDRVVPAHGMTSIQVCFKPGATEQQLFEVLSFEYNFGNPTNGSILVSLTGRSNKQLRYVDPFPCIVGWYDPIPSAYIGSEMTFDVELVNATGSEITITSASVVGFPMTSSPAPFAFVSQFPIIVPPNTDSNQVRTVRVKMLYKPTTSTSTAGIQDLALLRFELSGSAGSCSSVELVVAGIPVSQLSQTPSNAMVLFPKGNDNSVVNILDQSTTSRHTVEFTNNLLSPVTITDVELKKKVNFNIKHVGNDTFPMRVEPGASVLVELEFYRPGNESYSDQLTFHGSHEKLGVPFAVYGAPKNITSIDEAPVAQRNIKLNLSPNPSTGVTLITTSQESMTNTFEIYDVNGRLIASRVGVSRWLWDGRAASGERVTPGMYFVKASCSSSNGGRMTNIQQAIIVR